MLVTILDIYTFKFKKLSQNMTFWWWSEGNGSCDCNRGLFYEDINDDKCNSDRFLIVDFEDTNGEIDLPITKIEILNILNSGYSIKLIKKAINNYQRSIKINFLNR